MQLTFANPSVRSLVEMLAKMEVGKSYSWSEVIKPQTGGFADNCIAMGLIRRVGGRYQITEYGAGFSSACRSVINEHPKNSGSRQ